MALVIRLSNNVSFFESLGQHQCKLDRDEPIESSQEKGFPTDLSRISGTKTSIYCIRLSETGHEDEK